MNKLTAMVNDSSIASIERARLIIANTNHLVTKPSDEDCVESTVEGMAQVLKIMPPAFKKAQEKRKNSPRPKVFNV